MLLELEGLGGPIAFAGCDHMARDLARLLRGWRLRECDDSAKATPLITVEKTAGSYYLSSPWRAKPIRHGDPVDTVCSVIVDLIKGYIANDPDLLCLHCAAAEFAGRLVVFPSHYKAGKSLLSVSLAAAGVRLFADDVLPIGGNGNRGVAPGILPRLRLPLPDNSGAALRDYVGRRGDLRNRRFLYVDVGGRGLAPLGEQAPIGGFVLLRRQAGVNASLEPVAKSEMLKRVILRNFGHDLGSFELVERLHDVVGAARCCRLLYDHPGQAVDLLKRAFDHWDAAPPPARTATSVTRDAPRRRGRLTRTPGITERLVDDEMFLIDGKGKTIYHLNATSAALWRLMAEPATMKGIVRTLRQAFPDIPEEKITRDVRSLLADLKSRGLVQEASLRDQS